MRIVFFGTPTYVLPILEALHKKFRDGDKTPIVAVVTQSPKPTGRKQVVEYSAVDKWAHSRKIPTYYNPEDLVKDAVSADFGVLESFGGILSEKIINFFPHGILNAHPSLLPKYRGASPAQASILCGETTSGATIIKLDKFVDHGPIVWQFKEDVLVSDTAESLRVRIFEKSVDVFINLIDAYIKGKILLKEQNDNEAIMTWRIKKEEAFIPPKALEAATKAKDLPGEWKIDFIETPKGSYETAYSPKSIDQFIRAMSPWPQAWTFVKIKQDTLRLKIIAAHLESTPKEDTKLVIDTVQLEGKNQVAWEQFVSGYKDFKF